VVNSSRISAQTIAGQAFAIAVVALLVTGWWLTARGMPSYILPGPLDVLKRLSDFVLNSDLLYHMGVSFLRVGFSVFCALALAVVLGLMSHASPVVAAVVEKPVLTFLNSFPAVGWAILGIIWFQVSDATIIFIQVAIILPFCLINVLQGFSLIDADIDELGRSLSRSRWRRFTRITLPLIMPFLIAGLRIAYGICWKIALVSELFGSTSGLGYVMMQAQTNSDGATVFATCLVIVLIFALVDRLLFRPLARRYSVNAGRA